jgi:D-alanyl-D-alanine carboxypeptidase
MRCAEDKQEKTGVIYESWHWRFVGVKAAYEINDLGMCLEEYVEYKNK